MNLRKYEKIVVYPKVTKARNAPKLKRVADGYDPYFEQACTEWAELQARMQGLKHPPASATIKTVHTLNDNPWIRARYEQLIKESGHGRKYVYPQENKAHE